MEELLIRVQMPDDEFLAIHLQVGESIDRLSIGAPRQRQNGVDARAASAGENKRGVESFEFEMLQIVVMSAEIEIHAVLLEQWAPFRDQRPRCRRAVHCYRAGGARAR